MEKEFNSTNAFGESEVKAEIERGNRVLNLKNEVR